MHNRNAHTALPIYMQISESLMRDIAGGRYVEGERLPPERILAASYKTTVRTLRKSLAELEKNGMLERIQGSGNYVRNNADARSIYSMFRLELPTGGGLPSADILAVEYREKPADLPEFGASNHASMIRRLRYLDNIIIAVEEIWLDADSGRVDPAQLSDSLYLYYQKKLGFWVSRAVDSVSIDPTPDWAPTEFGVPHGGIAGYIERLSWAQDPAPVEFSRTWFDTKNARYVQRLQ
ncbi:GntR family transcriptional regulator [Celeribacter sp.]|uniref:GntR family transcriptional regulator n=1 Tax=Celeribacter sp. TaxID=1890673 RepID=UPI003A911BF9